MTPESCKSSRLRVALCLALGAKQCFPCPSSALQRSLSVADMHICTIEGTKSARFCGRHGIRRVDAGAGAGPHGCAGSPVAGAGGGEGGGR